MSAFGDFFKGVWDGINPVATAIKQSDPGAKPAPDSTAYKIGSILPQLKVSAWHGPAGIGLGNMQSGGDPATTAALIAMIKRLRNNTVPTNQTQESVTMAPASIPSAGMDPGYANKMSTYPGGMMNSGGIGLGGDAGYRNKMRPW